MSFDVVHSRYRQNNVESQNSWLFWEENTEIPYQTVHMLGRIIFISTKLK